MSLQNSNRPRACQVLCTRKSLTRRHARACDDSPGHLLGVSGEGPAWWILPTARYGAVVNRRSDPVASASVGFVGGCGSIPGGSARFSLTIR
jgi:hypothetical protein